MNKDNAKDYLPLVQALAEGKVIQIRTKNGWQTWDDCDFSAPAARYRIKHEPREIWVNQYPNWVDAGSYVSMLDAYNHRANDTAIQVRYREVIE